MLLATSCAGDPDPALSTVVPLAGFPTEVVEIAGREWTVAVAATPELRFRGLRGVDDLGELDGMLFVFDTTSNAAFTMRDTLMPIDIAFFDDGGALVDRLEMVPCAGGSCPSYRASGPFHYAVETESGGFDDLDVLTLVVEP